MTTELIIGDIVTINLKRSELPDEVIQNLPEDDDDDFFNSYYEGLVFGLKRDESKVKILFREYKDEEVAKWYSTDKIGSITREYKVIDLEENVDRNSGNGSLIAGLSKVEKTYWRTSKGLNSSGLFSPANLDTFIMPINSQLANRLLNSPEENVHLQLDKFRAGKAEFDGVLKQVYFLK